MATSRPTRAASLKMMKVAAPSAPMRQKRKKVDAEDRDTQANASKKQNTGSEGSPNVPAISTPVVNFHQAAKSEVIPAVLSFSFADAKDHLINADSRFKKLFSKLECKPFEHLEPVEPFRALATSILGQQISWKAARSIKHRFIRLFDPSLPEVPPPQGQKETDFFPTPEAVAAADLKDLRAAGLSGQKASYILDLAARFSDGRLSVEKLMTGTDEEVSEMLVAVKGIGPWTVNMFSIFSLRRPNILPVGDLGVQRGLLRWVVASHLPDVAQKTRVAPWKLPGIDEDVAMDDAKPSTSSPEASSLLPIPDATVDPPKTPTKKGRGKVTPPTPFTPSIFSGTPNDPITPIVLPDGLSIAALKARLAGKKAKGGVYLTPSEMIALSEHWSPYRSIAVWFMWSIVDEDAAS